MTLEKIKDNKSGKTIVVKRIKNPHGHKTEFVPVQVYPWSHEAKMSDEEYERFKGHPKITHIEREVPLSKEERKEQRQRERDSLSRESYERSEKSFKEYIDQPWIREDEKKELLAIWREDMVNFREALRQEREAEEEREEYKKLQRVASTPPAKSVKKNGEPTKSFLKQQDAKKSLKEFKFKYEGHPFDIISGYTWKSYDRYREITEQRMKENADLVRPTFNTPERLLLPISSGKILVESDKDLKSLSPEDKKKAAMYMKYSGMKLTDIAEKFDVSVKTIKRWTKGVRKAKKQEVYESPYEEKTVHDGWVRTGYRKGEFTPKAKTIKEGAKYKPGPGRPKGSKDKKPRKKRFEE